MKRFSHFLITVLGAALALILARLFIIIYQNVGKELSQYDGQTVTLYKVLAGINYAQVGTTFLLVLIYMLLLDLILVFVVRSWRKVRQGDKSAKVSKIGALKHFWLHYRTIHLVFILLSIFVTLSLTAPASVMNSFTAIVSISVLVSNLTKKIGKDD